MHGQAKEIYVPRELSARTKEMVELLGSPPEVSCKALINRYNWKPRNCALRRSIALIRNLSIRRCPRFWARAPPKISGIIAC